MGSTVSACLATPFQIKGVNYSISSACSTSAHCIGHAMELIQLGKQDVVFAGGGEELHWTMSALFDAMGALSSQYNETPERASRAYDANRDGFVIAGGGGMLVVESLTHAKARGATFSPSWWATALPRTATIWWPPRARRRALYATGHARARRSDRLHQRPRHQHPGRRHSGAQRAADRIWRAGTGDWLDQITIGPLTGRAGVQEAIYSLMMQDDFIAASANIETSTKALKACRSPWRGSTRPDCNR